MEFLNLIFVMASIGLGAIGWLRPVYTLETLDLKAGLTSMGPSEIRASAGCLFVGLGVGAWMLGTPAAYAMIGFAWSGAAIGRATSLIFDGQTRKKWGFFMIEALVGGSALWLNLGG